MCMCMHDIIKGGGVYIYIHHMIKGGGGCVHIGSPVGGPHSLGEIIGAAAVSVLSRLFVFAFAAHGGALGQERR
jgi:hypothetical protein